VKRALLEGSYLPRPVRGVDIPKRSGGVRTLGVPVVVDRLIQQALHQVLQPVFEPEFSDGSFGFRPRRSAQHAVRRAQAYIREGKRNVYVGSRVAGERLMRGIRVFLEEVLHLRVNAAKSAVARPWERAFLGYSVTAHRDTRLRIARQSVHRLTGRVRALLRSGRGRSLAHTIETLNPLLRGWIGYFQLTDGKRALEALDGWLRRRLRCLLWRQWKRPRTRARKLRTLGLDAARARRSAGNSHGPWWNAGASHLNQALPAAFFAHMGLVSLLREQRRPSVFVEPPDAEPHVRWCGRAAGVSPPPTRLR
jgi:hypothetical protein